MCRFVCVEYRGVDRCNNEGRSGPLRTPCKGSEEEEEACVVGGDKCNRRHRQLLRRRASVSVFDLMLSERPMPRRPHYANQDFTVFKGFHEK